MNLKVLLLIISVFLFQHYRAMGEADSKGSLDVNVLVQEALQVNPEVEVARSRWEAAKAKAVQAGVLEDPMVGLQFEGMPTSSADVGQYKDIEWSLTQNFPFPGKLSLKRKMALEEARRAYLEYREKEREIVEGVKKAYADYLLIYQTLEILERNMSLLQQFEETAKSKYEVGKAPQQNMLKAQVELAKIKNQVLIKEMEKQAKGAKINMLLARLPEEPLQSPAPVLNDQVDFDLEKLVSLAVKNRPELKALETQIRGAEYGLRLARREYWPNFFTRFATRQYQGEGLEEYDVMVGINIPWLWTRSRVQGGVQEAKSNRAAAQSTYEARKWMIFFEIKEALIKVKTSKSLMDLYRTDIVPKAEATVKISQTGYETDKIDFLMLLDSQRSLLEFQLENEEAAAEYSKSLAELERRVGTDLTNEKSPPEADQPLAEKFKS